MEHYKETMKNTDNAIGELMDFAWIKFLETRGRGKFDCKRTGTEMTNGKGMNCLKNFKRVTEGLVSLYQPDTKEHDWLLLRIPKWEALASAIYNVQCFF